MQFKFIKENATKKKFKKTFEVTFDSQREVDFFVAQMAFYYGFTDEIEDLDVFEVLGAVSQFARDEASTKGIKKYSKLLDTNFSKWLDGQLKQMTEEK